MRTDSGGHLRRSGAMPLFSLDPGIDVENAARTYRETGLVQIAPFLEEEGARALHEHLLARQDWRMRMRISGGRVIELGAAEAQAMGKAQSEALKKLAAPPREGFHYAYDSLAALDEEGVGAAAEGLLADFATFVSGPEAQGLLGSIIERDVRYVEVFGSRYRSGDFLTLHNDRQDGAERLAAYVLGLTPEWRPEWGGLLLFHGPDGEVERGLAPRFNVLNLFAVPKAHSVSVVAPFAPVPRLSVAGWLRARPPAG